MGIIEAIEVTGNYAYVGQGQELLILDITNSSSPVSVGKIMTKGFVNDIKVSGNYIYVCEGVNGFVILKANPEQLPLIVANFSSNVTFGNEPLSVQFNDSSVNFSR